MPDKSPPCLSPQWFQILLTLSAGEQHGLAIMREVADRTEGTMTLWPGMLYGNLRRLVDAGLVRETDGPAGAPARGGTRRYYQITAAGRTACTAEARRLRRYVDAARERRVLPQSRP